MNVYQNSWCSGELILGVQNQILCSRQPENRLQSSHPIPWLSFFILHAFLLATPSASFIPAIHTKFSSKNRARIFQTFTASTGPENSEQLEITRTRSDLDKRKLHLSTLAHSRRSAFVTIGAMILLPTVATAQQDSPLEELSIATGQWKQLDRAAVLSASNNKVPPSFCTYATRFLIHYDPGVSSWWKQLENKYSRIPIYEQRKKLGRAFGSLAKSIENALDPYLENAVSQEAYGNLYDIFMLEYGKDPEARRQIALLFSVLPPEDQPKSRLKDVAVVRPKSAVCKPSPGASDSQSNDDLIALLSNEYQPVVSGNAFAIDPPVCLYEVGIGEEFGQSAIATSFGPLAAFPLTRELPKLSFLTYMLFAISGATGCALTHALVIPLDVVKTRAQTKPGAYDNVVQGAVAIAKEEGIDGLFLGSQATIAGYFWYGLSVYPSYAFFKRFISNTLLTSDLSAAHVNDIALVAGALAAVVASLGLTPIEAARIRAVAEPETYRPLGLTGTLGVISREDPDLGWRNLYAGFPSLLTRQVIFGSVKFLAFERSCDVIFTLWPSLRDATLTSLAVSLVAGGISGTLSSIVSQPADSVLTFVARNSEQGKGSLSVTQGAKIMIEKNGIGSLYRGLSSRCVWAASIIAGQFLLYDIFRTFLGVNADDLTEVFELVLPNVN